MCGRMVLTRSASEIAEAFGLESDLELQPSYNVAPSLPVPVVRANASRGRRLDCLRWGLIPGWARDPAIGNRMINARSETVAEKPAFRAALRRRRCLVPADGFYEWAPAPAKGEPACPHYFHAPKGELLAIAGLWESWRGDGGAEGSREGSGGGSREEGVIESVTLITTEANSTVRPVHHRMPVLLEARDFDLWLDPAVEAPEQVLSLLVPSAPDGLEHHAVSPLVNNPRNDDPGRIEPL